MSDDFDKAIDRLTLDQRKALASILSATMTADSIRKQATRKSGEVAFTQPVSDMLKKEEDEMSDDLGKPKAPDKIWLHPITDDEFQDVWFADGADGGVEYVPAAALTEAQAEIARLKGALREVVKASANTGVLAASNCGLIARAALSSTPQG